MIQEYLELEGTSGDDTFGHLEVCFLHIVYVCCWIGVRFFSFLCCLWIYIKVYSSNNQYLLLVYALFIEFSFFKIIRK